MIRWSATDPTEQPVISGVENMQIRYCVPADSTDTNIGCVLAGNDVSDWNQIQSVRVSLLLRSADDNLVTQPQPYQFDINGGVGSMKQSPPATNVCGGCSLQQLPCEIW